ncbi:tetraacyldisaccharide 4'-kinase [Variovorax sp. RHLX14]|uniref:tetraacyldisaccharide 4'-kinase n=1 Tax=Variovorax sp. RHLX14 TaxID=1259731 RepID=UPI003F48B98E
MAFSGLPEAWLRRGTTARLLWPLSQIYRALTAVRRWLYAAGWSKSDRVPVPIVVVGNVVAGGAGKTPVVIAIVRHLQMRGFSVGVVSRGYGRRTHDCREVLADSDPRDVGDEPALLRHATGAPVFVASRRIEAARALLARHPGVQLIVSDDGLQHLAMRRDVEICVFDERGIGNGWLLPAGMLREPWPRHCDLVLHTGARAAFGGGFAATRALADYALRRNGERVALDGLGVAGNRPLVAVAAIARPEAFFSMLRCRGLRLTRTIALPDHHDFSDWQALPAVDGVAPVVLCTEKDAVKLWRSFPEALAIPLLFEPEPRFFEALDAKLSSLDGHQAA